MENVVARVARLPEPAKPEKIWRRSTSSEDDLAWMTNERMMPYMTIAAKERER